MALRTLVLFALLLQLACACAPKSPRPRMAEAPKVVAAADSAAEVTNVCQKYALAVQVLGSGGPIADDARAGAAYLVWVKGKARLLVDAGSGSFLRFGQSGARVEDLQGVAISHLHVDHVSALPALVKSAYFGDRSLALALFGPTGNARFPGFKEWIETQFGAQGGYRYLSGHTTGHPKWFQFDVKEVPADATQPSVVLDAAGLRISAVGVRHGTIPALGFLVEVAHNNRRYAIGFGGDQDAKSPAFEQLVKGAELLVLHHAIAEAQSSLSALHAPPKELARLAVAAAPMQLVLSHHMQRSLRDLAGAEKAIDQAGFRGRLHIARDLACYPIAP